MPLGTTLQRAMSLAFLGVVAGAAHSIITPVMLRPAPPAPWPMPAPASDASSNGPTANAPTNPAASTPEPLGLEIGLEPAFAFFTAGAPFVDARLLHEFEAGHVEGAFWMPAETFMNGRIPDAVNFMDRAAPVVVYCGGGQCDASHNVVVLLQQLGFTRCHVMKDGYKAWQDAGHPVATGKPQI
mgnify:CR=1 FL=1|jgi:rhodanese-related sulfurtransferase